VCVCVFDGTCVRELAEGECVRSLAVDQWKVVQ